MRTEWLSQGCLLIKSFSEKVLYLVEGYHGQVVVEVAMVGSGDDEQFLVVSRQTLVGIVAEVAGMGFLTNSKELNRLRRK